jgi:hypothetical protein
MWCRTALFCLVLVGCEDVFIQHPWEVEVPDDLRDLNTPAILDVQASLANDTFSFAVIGDPHFYYDDLDDAFDHINADGITQFTVVAGGPDRPSAHPGIHVVRTGHVGSFQAGGLPDREP